LVERDPGRLDLQRDLSVSYDNLGELQRALGDRDAARRYFESSLALDQRLVEREPGRSDLQRDLATSFERMASVDPEQAASALARAVEIRRTLCERNPGDIGTRCELGIALVQLGYAATDTHALTEGHEILRELRDRGELEARYHDLVDQLTELLGAT
jgi:tetratricopeptide (TPR) repeat protein